MLKQIDEKDLAAILAAAAHYPGGASRADIAKDLPQKLAPRTLQFRLRSLVEAGRLKPEYECRALKYHVQAAALAPGTALSEPAETASVIPVSRAGATSFGRSRHGSPWATIANSSTATGRM